MTKSFPALLVTQREKKLSIYLQSNHAEDQYFKEEDSGPEEVPHNSVNLCMNSWKDEHFSAQSMRRHTFQFAEELRIYRTG